MRQAVAAWRAEHGDVCPGYRIPPHQSLYLVADHVIPWRDQPIIGHSPLQVLCPRCNRCRGHDNR